MADLSVLKDIYADLKILWQRMGVFSKTITIILSTMICGVMAVRLLIPECAKDIRTCTPWKSSTLPAPPADLDLVKLQTVVTVVPPPPVPMVAPPPPGLPRIVVIESDTRKGVRENMNAVLKSDYEVLSRTQDKKWLEQIDDLAKEHPVILLAHLHSMRKLVPGESDLQRDLNAEVELLRGLYYLVKKNQDTRILLYSSSFNRRTAIDSYCAIQDAARRSAEEESRDPAAYAPLLQRIAILPWPDAPTSADESVLKNAVAASIHRSPSLAPYKTRQVCQQRVRLSRLDAQRRTTPASPTT